MELGEDGNVLVTEKMWLGGELCSIQLGAKERGWGLERAQLAANEDCYVPLEEWNCFVEEKPARLGNTIQPRFRGRDVAKGLWWPF